MSRLAQVKSSQVKLGQASQVKSSQAGSSESSRVKSSLKNLSKARNTTIQAGMMSIQAGNLYNPSLQHVNLSQAQNILSQVGNISSYI